MEKLKLKTDDLTIEYNNKVYTLFSDLAKEFPELLTEVEKDGKIIKTINIDKLKDLIGSFADNNTEIYKLTWAGKQKARIASTLPTTNTLRPIKEDSVDFENTENLYIEGDNLEVLKVLKDTYLGKIKMIYIDPPYNTNKDFVYKDKFSMSREEHEKESGIVDEEGNRLIKNTGSDGRFHSNWLNMMYPRLQLAHKLLSDDGIIFISIDDNEIYNLKKICDEIFGEKNFVANFVWIYTGKEIIFDNFETISTLGTNLGILKKSHEYILCYKKKDFKNNLLESDSNIQIDRVTKNGNKISKVIFPKGLKNENNNLNKTFSGIIGGSSEPFKIINPEGMIFKNGILMNDVELEAPFAIKGYLDIIFKGGECFDRRGAKILGVIFSNTGIPKIIKEKTGKVPSTILSGFGDTSSAEASLKKLFNNYDIFDYPKPKDLIKKLIELSINSDDIILDFFAGSSTTAQAVLEFNIEKNMNCNYILIQFPENLDESLKKSYSETIQNAINFLDSINKPHHLTEIGKERIRRAAKKIQEDNKDKDLSNVDFGFRVFRLDSSNMKDVYYSPSKSAQSTLNGLESNLKEDRNDKDLLYQVLLEMLIPISAKIEEQKINGKTIYNVNNNFMVACFSENVDLPLVKEIVNLKPLRIVFKDSSFNDDSAKVNCDEYIRNKLPDCIVKVV